MAKHSRDTCCAHTGPGGYCCTIPQSAGLHQYHEGWRSWGQWTGNNDPDVAMPAGAKPLQKWINQEWKEEKGKGIAAMDFGTGFDEYDLLPDLERKDYDDSGKCLLPTWEELNAGKRSA